MTVTRSTEVTFSLNGQQTTVAAGTTILEAAQETGVEIPT